jgi:hypothetical protein
MEKDFDYPNLIEKLDEERRIKFYEALSHNLTVSIRAIWSNDNLSDTQKLECMKWINEILHGVIQKTYLLRRKQNEFSENDSWERIKHWVSVHPMIGGHVGWAIKTSYNSVFEE